MVSPPHVDSRVEAATPLPTRATDAQYLCMLAVDVTRSREKQRNYIDQPIADLVSTFAGQVGDVSPSKPTLAISEGYNFNGVFPFSG